MGGGGFTGSQNFFHPKVTFREPGFVSMFWSFIDGGGWGISDKRITEGLF